MLTLALLDLEDLLKVGLRTIRLYLLWQHLFNMHFLIRMSHRDRHGLDVSLLMIEDTIPG